MSSDSTYAFPTTVEWPLSYKIGLFWSINIIYHLTLNPGLAAGYSLRLWAFLSWRLEWLQNIYPLACHHGQLALPFLLSHLQVIENQPEAKTSAELHPTWLLSKSYHFDEVHTNSHHYFLVSSSIKWDNENRPDHPTVVLSWVPAAVRYELSHKLKCTLDLLGEGTYILMLLAVCTTISVALRFHERRS